MSEPSIESLFLRYRDRGDSRALGEVFDRLAPKMQLIAAHLRGGDQADDLIQSTFLDLIEQRDRWDGVRPLTPWVIGLLGQQLRRARRQVHRWPVPERLTLATVVEDEDGVEAKELLQQVVAAVEDMPLHYRQVLSLRLVHGLEAAEISASLDLPLNSVKTRLRRGMDRLRQALPIGLSSVLLTLLSAESSLASTKAQVLSQAASALTHTSSATASTHLHRRSRHEEVRSGRRSSPQPLPRLASDGRL